ncbi:hypothetical protein [uncultured Gimesia sp.]|uniref:hypothetical protein n=1 Tax=uncultured Gimesia sp. TaxID=1678688 RepID=UPI0026149261|nr:hypothetical protein [uncultured Gimesia sp.]
MAKVTTTDWKSNSDNIEFVELVERLSNLELSQRDVAGILDVSQGQVNRVRKGQQHASVTHLRTLRKEVRRLTEERSSEPVFAPQGLGHSTFELNQAILRSLSAVDAVNALRNLLWARAAARGMPTTRVSITSDVYTADGGVDASILDGEEPLNEDELLTAGTRFQIKTGDFAPWRKSEVQRELFGQGEQPAFENLGSEIQQTLQEGKRFVLVSFGVDPIDRDLRKARKNFEHFFGLCGYSKAVVEVWGQTQLIGLFRSYPSLCLQLHGHDHQNFRSRDSWLLDDDMQPREHYSTEQQKLIDNLRNALRTGELVHVRLIGEPGVGKTRLALELTKVEDLAPVTLYVRDGQTILQSSFINELVQTDDRRFVFFIIDECSQKDLADIWNILKPRSDRIRIITIDHGPDSTVDDKTRVVTVEPTGLDQIVSILKDHNVSENDAKRWAEYCEGCPRVAHVIGTNLDANRSNLLAAPTTSEVWRRFVDGRDSPDSEAVQLRRIVLHYISLFERFGFEDPVGDEADFIQTLAARCDQRITGPKFRAIVRELQSRRIIQGVTTLYITPRLLHINLYREFWQLYGTNFDIATTLQEMPQQMWDWFVQMLRYAHECAPAEKAIDKLLGHNGIFKSDEFPDTHHNGRMIAALAETCPKQTLRCLRRTIGEMDVAALQQVTESRQWLVWALEKLAVWEDCFANATELLLVLAEAENVNNSNEATSTFTSLFSLIPGWAATQASPGVRINVLVSALDSDSAKIRKLGLIACSNALSTEPGFRTVGPEHQGLKPTILFWVPQTYGERWDAYREVWQLLVDRLKIWEGEDRRLLITSILKAAWSVLHIKVLTDSVVETLESIALDEQTDVKALVEFTKRQLRHGESKLPENTKRLLKSICDRLDGHDFASTLRRFVKHTTWEDYHDDELNETKLVDRKLDELAESVRNDPDLLVSELPWLVCEDSSPAYCFAFNISKDDSNRLWLPKIREQYATLKDASATSFLSGYLRAIFIEDEQEWESVMLDLADDSATADRFSDFVVSSGMTNAITRRVIDQCRSGLQSKERLKRWWSDRQLQQLDEEVVKELVSLQLEDGIGTLWSSAVQMCHSFYIVKDDVKSLPEDLVFDLLTADAMADERVVHSASYYWSGLAKAFINQFPHREWDLFGKVIRISILRWSVLEDLDANKEAILTSLLRKNPETAWACIADAYREARERGEWLSQNWLTKREHHGFEDDSPGPIQFVPANVLFDWVDEDVDENGYWLTGVLPKTLNNTNAGRLTRDFVAKYGKNESLRSGLYARFGSRSWCGNASDHYRNLRTQARGWLIDEKNSTVIRWIEDYIEGLNYDIERAEIEEERRC